MNFTNSLRAGAAALALSTAFASIATPALAQQTSSAIRGTVVDANGDPVSGAQITIVHAPTASADTATTTASGTFVESGLRVGGPYTITITAPGFEAETISGLYLEPGNAERITIDLSALTASDEIIVIGRATEQLSLNNGVGSAFDRETISNQPSVNRDIIDTLVRDPLVNQTGGTDISIGGFNPRLNALALDGVLQGDDFGLSQSLYPTSRAPISLEAVESASIVAADYSVLSSGYQGGLVNVVTKSGTNEFQGSGYWFRSGQNFLGEISDGTLVPAPEFKEREWGWSLGGPIVKDKLFFFLSFEDFSSASPASFAGDDASNGITDPETFFSLINDRVLAGTGFDAGGRPSSVSLPSGTRRWLGKIDFNINDDHRLEASYQRTRETGTSVDANSLLSAFYETPQELDTYSGGIYSDWTENFSTSLRVGYKDNSRGQNCGAPGFSAIELFELNPGDFDAAFAGTFDPAILSDLTLVAGCDRFRHANTFTDDRLQIFASGEYQIEDHLVRFGAEWESYSLENLFLEGANGTFRYDDLTELATGNDVEVTLRGVASGVTEDALVEFGFEKLSLFLEDEWQLTSELSVNAGLRYERFFQSDEPPLREDFVSAYGRPNTENLAGRDIFLPRIGFNYQPFDRTTISGGFGLFAGGAPQIWAENAFLSQIFDSVQVVDGAVPGVIPAANLAEFATFDPSSPAAIDLIDPDFKIPSQWKGSLRLTQGFDMDFGVLDLGTDYLLTIQYLHSNTKNDYIWQNIAQTDLGLPIGVAPDGRPIYSNLNDLGVDNAIQLSNSQEGRSHVFTIALAKEYESGFSFNTSYAYQDVETASSVIGSSRGISLFRSLFTADRNNPGAVTAPFEIEHAFNLNFGYETELFDDLKTRFDLFATITSGRPTPVTFNVSSSNPLFGQSGNGETTFDNDLLYIPTMANGMSTDSRVIFGAGFDGAAFEGFVLDQGLEQGAVVNAGEVTHKWNQLWNFRFQQEIPFTDFGQSFLEDNRLMFTVDIYNVANLINDKWGRIFDGPRFTALPVVTAELVDADTLTTVPANTQATACASEGDCVYRYTGFTDRATSFQDLDDSVYQIRVGVRYEF